MLFFSDLSGIKRNPPNEECLYTVSGKVGQLPPCPPGLQMKVPGGAGCCSQGNKAWFLLCLSHCCQYHTGRGTKTEPNLTLKASSQYWGAARAPAWPRGRQRADNTRTAALLLFFGGLSPGLTNLVQGPNKPGRREGRHLCPCHSRVRERGRSSCRLSLAQFKCPDSGVRQGLFLPRPRGPPYRPRGRYNQVVFRLIDSGISSQGQGVEDYTSCFKNYLCYRLVLKILASGMFVFL